MNLNSASFRDPSGHVFSYDGKIYRSIFEAGAKDYNLAHDAGIYDKLIDAGLLLPHKEVDVHDFCPQGTVYCLNHPKLPMISYPWEWSFSMLKDAALIHLEAMEMLLAQGFWLRDANAFNVQFDGKRIRIIDTLSIGRRVPDTPWVGYRQFCSHFLAPLACAAYRDIRTLSLWRNYIDGYPLDFATKLLPFLRRFQPRLLLHLTFHARLQESADRRDDIGKSKPRRNPKVSDRALTGLIRSLRRTIEGIKWKRHSEIWEEYETIRTYKDDDVVRKSEYVDKVVGEVRPEIVWDLGGNIGEFSFIAASQGAFVVSIDGDPACTEYVYERISRENRIKSILPLTMDLSNPSPGLGWDNRERPGLSDRGPADLVLALALIHHLVFSNNVPMYRIAEWLSSIANCLLVEFVPPSDPMVQKLLMNRGDEHLPYSHEIFLSAFGERFYLVDQVKLDNDRELIFYKRKKIK